MKKLLLMGFLISAAVYGEDFQVQTIGVAGKYYQSFYKSDEKIIPVPLINLNYNRFFLNGVKAGFTLYEEEDFKFSAIIDPLGGYFDGFTVKAKDMDKGYEKIEDRDSKFMYGLNLDFNLSENVFGNINYMFGEEGDKGEAYLTYVGYITDRLVILPSISAKYYSDDFVDYYVGVTKKEVLENEKIKKEYKGDNSFSLGASITAEYSITEQFIVSAFTGYEYFDEKISDSPLVDKDNQVYYGVGFRYSF